MWEAEEEEEREKEMEDMIGEAEEMQDELDEEGHKQVVVNSYIKSVEEPERIKEYNSRPEW